MTVKVLGCRVLVKPDPQPEHTADGKLHLVYDRQRSTMTGTVIARGSGPQYIQREIEGLKDRVIAAHPELKSEIEGIVVPSALDLPAGTRVIFSPDAGQELFFEHDAVICLDEDDLLAVIA